MSLEIGSRIAHYDVTALIGEGGMGQVYQATDTKLNRQVALKILPEAFAADPDRLARFQREAQVLASLNHPNIAQIYGIEKQDGTRALVLELVEGPTLAERIAQGPIPVDEALPIAKQIAEALEAAHEAGVIHRDLKPANVKVKDDGTVKVLDFGLAKALQGEASGDPSESPTLTAAATQMGVILGTAAYMSPEQATGKPLDKRTDVWAFGVVVYEILTGRPAFAGDNISEVLANVIKSEPDWDALSAGVPPLVESFLRRCVSKARPFTISNWTPSGRRVSDYMYGALGGAHTGDALVTTPVRGSYHGEYRGVMRWAHEMESNVIWNADPRPYAVNAVNAAVDLGVAEGKTFAYLDFSEWQVSQLVPGASIVTCVPFVASDPNPDVRDFVSRAKGLTGNGLVTHVAFTHYNALMVLKAAMERSGEASAAGAFAGLDGLAIETATGRLTLDASGYPTMPMFVATAEGGGELQIVEKIDQSAPGSFC